MADGTRIEMADGTFALQVALVNTGQATAATKSEDAAAASGDAGVPAMAVQTASPADAATAGDYAFLQMKDGRLWTRATEGLTASAAFTPAAASHDGASAGTDVGDVVGGAQTFTLGAPASSNFLIRSVSMLIASATVATTAWKLHLFSVTPPSAIADDAIFDLPSGDRASYLGYIAIPQIVDFGASQWIESNNIFKQVKLGASGNLFAYLTNDTTLTPEAVAHTVTITGSVV